MDVVAVDEFVDAEALLADVVEERRGVAGEDFGDGGVAEHGVQAADAGGEFVGRAAAAGVLEWNRWRSGWRRRSSGWREGSRD